MRRLLAIQLVALLAENSLPLAAQPRLVYRVSGKEIQPNAIYKDPKSCCAVERTSSGELKPANRCCCKTMTTPSHAPLRKASPNGAFFGFNEHQFCIGKHPEKGSLFTAKSTAVLLHLPRFQSSPSEQ
jgi:hypothetical protein